MSDAEITRHASAVSFDGVGVLILGASGRGKSALALELLALGAELIADDRTCLRLEGDQLVASAPKTLSGMIEVRFVGILQATTVPQCPVHLVIDLDQTETNRLPPNREWSHAGVTLPCLHNVEHRCFPAAIRQYVYYGRFS